MSSDDANDRAADAALRASEAKYRTLFDSIDEGFCIVEIMDDQDGKAVDYRILEVNAVFEQHTGIANAAGKRGSEIDADLGFHGLERYDHVARTGEPLRTETYHARHGRWYAARVSRVGGAGSRQVAIVFDDITGRKHHEANQKLLAEISGEFAAVGNIAEAMERLGEKIGRHFGAKQCAFSEVANGETAVTAYGWHAPDVPSIKGIFQMRDFLTEEHLAAHNAGEISVVRDTANDPRVNAESYGALGMRSFVMVPLVRDHHWRFLIKVVDNQPRQWSDGEIELIRELVTRIWARLERARAEEALRESEGLRRIALEGGRMGAWRWDLRHRLVWGDADFAALWGLAPTDQPFPLSIFTDPLSPEGHATIEAVVTKAVAQGEEFDGQLEVVRGPVAGQWIRWRGRAERDRPWMLNGVSFDVTEQKRAEGHLRESEERQAFLLQMSDALRSLDDPLEIQQVAMRMLGQRLNATRAFYFFTEPAENGDWIHVIETDHLRDPGMPSHAGRHAIKDFGLGLFEGAEQGRVVAVEDVTKMALLTAAEVQKFLAVEVVAFINVPLIQHGKFVAGIGAHDRVPRPWKPEEIALIQEVAARVWTALESARAEKALRASEERLRGALSISTVGVMFWRDLRLTEINDAYLRMSGFAREEILGRPWEDLTPEEFHPITHRRLAELAATGESTPFEKQFFCKDGSRRWGRYAGRMVGGELVEFVIDITSRRHAEQVVSESEHRLRTLADAVPQIIWTNSGDGVANYFNQRWHEYSGLTHEESYGLGWEAIVHPDDAPRSVPAWAKALAAGVIFDTEYRLRGQDGAYRWFIGRNVPMRNAEGQVVGWFGTATDIHDLKLAEQETERARAAAEAAGAAKDHFLAVLSHELRTPLMPISMALAVLTKRSDLPEAVTRAFAMIQRNVDLEKQLIAELLDVTAIARSKMEITRVDMDLYQAVERAVEVSTPDIEAKQQRFTVTLEGAACPYHGDFARLQQVFWNLLKNASKFTPKGGAIEIRSRGQVGGQFVVEVIDTGIGLEANAIEHIFQPFEQANVSIMREFGGLGLGLAIAKATVDAHGGTLSASSPGLGRGATFTVSLPPVDTAVGTREITAR